MDKTFNLLVKGVQTVVSGSDYTGSQHLVRAHVTAELTGHERLTLRLTQACKTTLPAVTKQASRAIKQRVKHTRGMPEWRTTAACSNCTHSFSPVFGSKGWKHCPNCKRYEETRHAQHTSHHGRSMSRDLNAAKNMALWTRHVLLFGCALPSLQFCRDEPTFVTSDPVDQVQYWRRDVALQRAVAHVVLTAQAAV